MVDRLEIGCRGKVVDLAEFAPDGKLGGGSDTIAERGGANAIKRSERVGWLRIENTERLPLQPQGKKLRQRRSPDPGAGERLQLRGGVFEAVSGYKTRYPYVAAGRYSVSSIYRFFLVKNL